MQTSKKHIYHKTPRYSLPTVSFRASEEQILSLFDKKTAKADMYLKICAQHSDNYMIRYKVTKGIAERNEPKFISILTELTKDPCPEVVEAAMDGLNRIKAQQTTNDESIADLVIAPSLSYHKKMLESQDKNERDRGLKCIMQDVFTCEQMKDIENTLWELCNKLCDKGFYDAGAKAILALQHVGSANWDEIAMKMTNYPNTDARRVAIELLALSADPNIIVKLIDKVHSDKDLDALTYGFINGSNGNIPKVIELASLFIESETEEVRNWASFFIDNMSFGMDKQYYNPFSGESRHMHGI